LHHELERLLDCCDRDAEDTIRRTLGRLPAEVRDFALDQCVFASIGPELPAMAIQPPPGRWVVLLSEGEPSESVVAHEIAHAWLGHETWGTVAEEPRLESEVRGLLISWVFTGLGATIDGHASG
jgi:hypothetical protein